MRKIISVIKTAVFAAVLIFMLTGCFPSTSSQSAVESVPSESFKSEKELLEAILAARLKYPNWEDAELDAEQETDSDPCMLRTITDVYRPANVPPDFMFSSIIVYEEYIGYDYKNASGKMANLSWLRNITYEDSMEELEGRDYIEKRDVERNGTKYTLVDWKDASGKITGMTIHWETEGESFMGSYPVDYDDDQVIDFCQVEKIAVDMLN